MKFVKVSFSKHLESEASCQLPVLLFFIYTFLLNIYYIFLIIIIIIIIIIYHDLLPTPRRGSHVKSGKTHTQSSRYTP